MEIVTLLLILNWGVIGAWNPVKLIGKVSSTIGDLKNKIDSDALAQISSTASMLQNLNIQSQNDLIVYSTDIEYGLKELVGGFRMVRLSHHDVTFVKMERRIIDNTFLQMEKMIMTEAVNFRQAINEAIQLRNDGAANSGVESADRADEILQDLALNLHHSIGTLSNGMKGLEADSVTFFKEALFFFSETLERVILAIILTCAILFISSSLKIFGIVFVIINILVASLVSDAIISQRLSQFNASGGQCDVTDSLRIAKMREQVADVRAIIQLKQKESFRFPLRELMYPRPLFANQSPPPIFSASSSWHGNSHGPNDSVLHKSARDRDCWHRGKDTGDQEYLQVELGNNYLITEIHTRGRPYEKRLEGQHIKRYRIEFVNENNENITLKNLDGGTEFDANYDATSVAINTYFHPFVAHLVRIYPFEYFGNMCLNWELIGVDAKYLEALQNPPSNA
jgi:hypothetical protein